MKKLLFTAMLLPLCIAATAAHSHVARKAQAPKHNYKHNAAAVAHSSVIYVGTNDFYLALVREGVYKG